MIDLRRAYKIEGWMDPKELFWLANEAKKRTRIIEVGCWMGRSTRALADHTAGMVMAVDTWKGSEEHQSALADKPTDWLYGQFLANMNGLNNVFPIRKSSVEAAEMFKRNGLKDFDMVFIDASHDYENVKADIEAWRPLVMAGGIMCGHDRGYPPVTKAVEECLGKVGGETDIWVKQL